MSAAVVIGAIIGALAAVLLCCYCARIAKRKQAIAEVLDDEERRFKDTLETQAGELDNLFDFDQDDVEFDEKELEQLKMLSQGGDLNFLDPDDIELGVPRQDTDAETDDEARADAELTGVAQHKPSRPMMQSSKPVKPSKSKAKKKKLSGHAD